MQRIRYELDPHNRLVLDKTGRRGNLPEFRKVIDGQFKTDKNNNLSYHVKSPLAETENTPHQLNLKGEWSLGDNHDLQLTLDKQGRETFGDKITLQGKILDVSANSLLFAVTTKTKENTKSTYGLSLGGSWRADENNRLSFHVNKEKGRHDILTFNGAWEVNKNHRIVYEYEKAELIRKKRKTHTLTFEGYWDIKDKARISYVLSKSTDSVFSPSTRPMQAQPCSGFHFQTSAGIFREGCIKYELGIGLEHRARPVEQTVTLFGRWKLKEGAGLIFEVEYENKKTHAITFGGDAKLTDKDTIAFRLKNDVENKDIGVNLELSRKILKGDGEAFTRLLKSRKETGIYIGSAWRW